MHLHGTAAVQDMSAAARVIQGLALVSLCKAKSKPRTISPKPMLLSFSVCTCHPAQQYLCVRHSWLATSIVTNSQQRCPQMMLLFLPHSTFHNDFTCKMTCLWTGTILLFSSASRKL